MTSSTLVTDLEAAVSEAVERRVSASEALAGESERVARACRDMATRFQRGGRLVVFGNGGAGTDANHIAVEFVHPVIVGKRALPAFALTNDLATVTGVASSEGFAEIFAHQLRHLGAPADIALGLSADGGCDSVLRGLETARELGMLTVGFTGEPAREGSKISNSQAIDHALVAQASDPAIITEVHTTAYHILWELVHVFFEQPGALESEVVT